MNNVNDLPADMKHSVACFLDATSFVSLCCTNRAWNRLLQHSSSSSLWERRVQEHYDARLRALWKHMLSSSPRLRVSVHRYGVVLSRDWQARDAALYENGRAWLRLQELRRAEMDTMVLLDEDLWHPAYSVKAHRRRLAAVASFSVRVLAASLSRLTELDAAIAMTHIGWAWSRVDDDTERAVRAVHSELPVLYLESCGARAAECCRLNDVAIQSARDSFSASSRRVARLANSTPLAVTTAAAAASREEIRRLVAAEKDASASHLEFLELRRVLLARLKEVCARELVAITSCKRQRRAA